MKRLLLLALLPLSAIAGNAQLSWTQPTTNTDGSAIAASGAGALASTRVEYFQCAAVTSTWPASPTVVSVLAPAATHTVSGLTDGLRYCFRIASVNNGGSQSAYSATLDKLMPVPVPNPPTFTAIAVVAGANVAPAYRILADGTRSTVLAGFVPIGKACTGAVAFTYRGASFRRVARVDVQWWGTAATDSVAAACG